MVFVRTRVVGRTHVSLQQRENGGLHQVSLHTTPFHKAHGPLFDAVNHFAEGHQRGAAAHGVFVARRAWGFVDAHVTHLFAVDVWKRSHEIGLAVDGVTSALLVRSSGVLIIGVVRHNQNVNQKKKVQPRPQA